eukprot:24592-Pelagomonas_calceolata.AAC.1
MGARQAQRRRTRHRRRQMRRSWKGRLMAAQAGQRNSRSVGALFKLQICVCGSALRWSAKGTKAWLAAKCATTAWETDERLKAIRMSRDKFTQGCDLKPSHDWGQAVWLFDPVSVSAFLPTLGKCPCSSLPTLSSYFGASRDAQTASYSCVIIFWSVTNVSGQAPDLDALPLWHTLGVGVTNHVLTMGEAQAVAALEIKARSVINWINTCAGYGGGAGPGGPGIQGVQRGGAGCGRSGEQGAQRADTVMFARLARGKPSVKAQACEARCNGIGEQVNTTVVPLVSRYAGSNGTGEGMTLGSHEDEGAQQAAAE